MKIESKFRSSCPMASILDVLGDKWSLLIVRDMLLGHKRMFKEISSSDENISPSVLSSRLKLLESFHLITKQKLPENKKEIIYLLTEQGVALAPLIVEAILWSDSHVRPFNQQMLSISGLGFKGDKPTLIGSIQNKYREMVKDTSGA